MKKFTKKQIILIIAAVVLIVAAIATGIYYSQSAKTVTANTAAIVSATPESNWENNVLTYKGKDGVTAEELIGQFATITKDKYGMVATINGVAPTGNQYWQFNINGESSNEGAGTYITKSSETITWKLASF